MCGSMSLIDRFGRLADVLRAAGHDVVAPRRHEVDGRWSDLPLAEQVALQRALVDEHLGEIRAADAVLLANLTTKGVPRYVGASALMEAAFARAIGLPVYLWEPPGSQPCQLEVLALQAACLDSDPGQLPSRIEPARAQPCS